MNWLFHLGRYWIFIKDLMTRPEKFSIYWKQFVRELDNFGYGSLGIVALVSVFMGAVITIQTVYNLVNPLIPMSAVGIVARDSIILEFSPTMISLVLAGKIGSSIASEIGTMRVTEQMDALQVMGINPASYLVLPKIGASLLFFPVLVIFSIFMGLLGGYLAGDWLHLVNPESFLTGYFDEFRPYYVVYSLTKTVVFAFIISSISAWYGFNVKGGAVEVGKASTKAVVAMSFSIILFNYILTDVMLQ